MTNVYRAALLSLTCATLLLGCAKDDQTILLVDVDQGTLDLAPNTITLRAYKGEGTTRIEIGSIPAIAWETARKGLGLRLKDTAAGVVTVEADGVPTGIAGPISTNVVAKQSTSLVKLSFRPGTRTASDGGIDTVDGGTIDGGKTPDAVVPDGLGLDSTAVPGDAGRETSTPSDAGVPGADTISTNQDAARSPSDTAGTMPDVPLPSTDSAARDGQVVDTAIVIPDTSTDTRAQTAVFTTPQRLDPTTNRYQFPPTIAVDPVREHVYVAWVERDLMLSTQVVKVKRWNKTTTAWSATQTMEVPGGRPLEADLRLGVDTAGNVFLAWCQKRSTDNLDVEGVWVSQATLSSPTEFSTPKRIATGIASELSLGVSANGVAFLVFNLKSSDGKYFEIHTATYSGGTWNKPTDPLFPPNSTTSQSPALAVSDVGTALVVFDRQATMHARTGTFLLTATDRTDLGNVDPAADSDVSERYVAMNRVGEGVLVWTRAMLSEMAVATYSPSGGWSAAKTIATGSFQDYFSAALSDDGTIAVAYAKKANTTYNLAVQTGKMTGTFTATTYLESDNKSTNAFMNSIAGEEWDFSYPRFAVAPTGNKTAPDSMFLVFHKKESETTSSLWGTRLLSGTWTTPALIARTADMHALEIHVDVSDSGFGAYAFLLMDAQTPSPNPNDMQVFAGFYQP